MRFFAATVEARATSVMRMSFFMESDGMLSFEGSDKGEVVLFKRRNPSKGMSLEGVTLWVYDAHV